MAESHGKKAVFKLAPLSAPTVVVDISQYLDSASLPQSLDQAETSAFGDQFKQFVAGLADSQIPLSGNWDEPIHDMLAELNLTDTPVMWEYHPAGTAVNQTKYSGTCIVPAYSWSGAITDKQTFTATLQQSASIARALN